MGLLWLRHSRSSTRLVLLSGGADEGADQPRASAGWEHPLERSPARRGDGAVADDGRGREPRKDGNADDDWRAYSDGTGELVIFCPECAEREFSDAS